jgi:hypothetical protein
LPYPVARAVRSLEFGRQPKEHYEAILAVAEGLTVALGALAAAWCRQYRRPVPSLVQLQEAYLRQGVSMGHWQAVVEDAAKASTGHPQGLSGLVEAVAYRPKGSSLMPQLRQLVRERNEWAHGSGPHTRIDAAVRVDQQLPAVLTALDRVAFLARDEWVLVEDANYRRIDRNFGITAQRVMGEHPEFEVVRFDSAEPLANEVLYVRTPHGYLPLSPFIVVRDCVICRQREVFYADRVQQGQGVVLKSFERGHKIHDQTLVDEVAAVLPEPAQ